ncbi:MAG TPA: hypothetical protein VK211_03960 [Kamptonema sp.]|nr:hypothetical protein [Kamptonema sp.]
MNDLPNSTKILAIILALVVGAVGEAFLINLIVPITVESPQFKTQ